MDSQKKGISRDTVKHIAKLARIKLSENDVKKFQEQFVQIISYFDRLNEVDTKNVEPTSQVTGLVNKLREDKVKGSLETKESLKDAPKKNGNYFTVPSPLKRTQ
jgi:aspartyl-tRNA(Asn)/glutamyl-tRNA(Gln) amidotransferase subunit C